MAVFAAQQCQQQLDDDTYTTLTADFQGNLLSPTQSPVVAQATGTRPRGGPRDLPGLRQSMHTRVH